jgi:DNA invertase Pin-like site-specific DNA recombinase
MGKKKRAIAYYRVSTDKQGIRGLGIEAQEAAVAAYIAAEGATIVETYREVESGKKSDRPQLKLAMDHAKRLKATLVIGKLDRLSRNLAFIANLMESGVDFVACDLRGANRFTLHIMAAMAEQEALMISQRTKAGLAALRARGMVSATPGKNFGKVVTLGNRGQYFKPREDDRRLKARNRRPESEHGGSVQLRQAAHSRATRPRPQV